MGGGVEASGDEEHAKSVVVVVALSAGGAPAEFDDVIRLLLWGRCWPRLCRSGP